MLTLRQVPSYTRISNHFSTKLLNSGLPNDAQKSRVEGSFRGTSTARHCSGYTYTYECKYPSSNGENINHLRSSFRGSSLMFLTTRLSCQAGLSRLKSFFQAPQLLCPIARKAIRICRPSHKSNKGCKHIIR